MRPVIGGECSGGSLLLFSSGLIATCLPFIILIIEKISYKFYRLKIESDPTKIFETF